jgi:hypothetical protein
MAPCSLVGVDRRFRAAYYLHHQGEAQGSHLHTRRLENPVKDAGEPKTIPTSKKTHHNGILLDAKELGTYTFDYPLKV